MMIIQCHKIVIGDKEVLWFYVPVQKFLIMNVFHSEADLYKYIAIHLLCSR